MSNKRSGHGLSFTMLCDKIAPTLPAQVVIESAISPGNKIEADAIWDTGATSSLIRPEIAIKLNLKPISKTLMTTPSDKDVPSNVYLIHTYLPNGAKIENIQVLEGITHNCDMIIGMDVITLEILL